MVKISELFGSYNFIVEDHSGNFTCKSFTINRIDASNNPVTATLPATPKDKDQIQFLDLAGNNPNNPTGLGKNLLTIVPNGTTIQGYSEDLILNQENSSVSLIYDATDNNWNVLSASLGGFSSGSGGATVNLPLNVREQITQQEIVNVTPSDDLQALLDTWGNKDLGIYEVIFQLADGTYTLSQNLNFKAPLGNGNIIIQGNNTNPSLVTIDNNNFTIVNNSGSKTIGFKFKDLTLNNALSSPYFSVLGSVIALETVKINSSTNNLIDLGSESLFLLEGNIDISAIAAPRFINNDNGIVRATTTIDIDVTGSDFTSQFVRSVHTGYIRLDSSLVSYIGSATGQRYRAEFNGVIQTNSGGNTATLPGNTNGLVSNGGVYN